MYYSKIYSKIEAIRIRKVSESKQTHQYKDVAMDKIRALALVKASIRKLGTVSNLVNRKLAVFFI